MSTTSSISTIGGVQSYEDSQNADLYATSDSQTLGQDTFLTLLTVQLQNQDPLNPMDNTEFVSQLSQFSSLEQLTNANDKLQSLAVGMSSVGSATMVNMIGKEVRAIGDGFHYESGSKELNFELAAAASSMTISIYDSSGSLVKQETLDGMDAGEHTYTWNGLNSNGTQVPAGDFTYSIAAVNGSDSVDVTTYTQGLVDQIDYASGVAMPRVDGQTVTVDKIVQILEAEQNAEVATN